jgi:hypothetical protein
VEVLPEHAEELTESGKVPTGAKAPLNPYKEVLHLTSLASANLLMCEALNMCPVRIYNIKFIPLNT